MFYHITLFVCYRMSLLFWGKVKYGHPCHTKTKKRHAKKLYRVQPWWLSGLERVSNSCRHSLETLVPIPLWACVWYHRHSHTRLADTQSWSAAGQIGHGYKPLSWARQSPSLSKTPIQWITREECQKKLEHTKIQKMQFSLVADVC